MGIDFYYAKYIYSIHHNRFFFFFFKGHFFFDKFVSGFYNFKSAINSVILKWRENIALLFFGLLLSFIFSYIGDSFFAYCVFNCELKNWIQFPSFFSYSSEEWQPSWKLSYNLLPAFPNAASKRLKCLTREQNLHIKSCFWFKNFRLKNFDSYYINRLNGSPDTCQTNVPENTYLYFY